MAIQTETDWYRAYMAMTSADNLETKEGALISTLADLVGSLIDRVDVLENKLSDLRGEVAGNEKEWE